MKSFTKIVTSSTLRRFFCPEWCSEIFLRVPQGGKVSPHISFHLSVVSSHAPFVKCAAFSAKPFKKGWALASKTWYKRRSHSEEIIYLLINIILVIICWAFSFCQLATTRAFQWTHSTGNFFPDCSIEFVNRDGIIRWILNDQMLANTFLFLCLHFFASSFPSWK